MRSVLVAVLLMVGGSSTASAARGGDRGGPAASAAEIPALARLLEKAGWEPTPELSGVFKTGSVFLADGQTHSLMVRSCFTAEEAVDTYTSAEVVTQMQAGVRVKFGLGSVEGSGELVKKVKFGTPEHATIERLAMIPTEACSEMLASVAQQQLDEMYAVQEVLTAQIAEQTCGRIDATGRFVGLGKAEGELAQACTQESLEPVAVAYRVVPLSELVDARPAVALPTAPGPVADCRWGAVQTFVVPSMSRVAVNGEVIDIRGLDARAAFMGEMHRCGFADAAAAFEGWRAARRTTNIACATLIGCYPLGVGLLSAMVAKKRKNKMIGSIHDGLAPFDGTSPPPR